MSSPPASPPANQPVVDTFLRAKEQRQAEMHAEMSQRITRDSIRARITEETRAENMRETYYSVWRLAVRKASMIEGVRMEANYNALYDSLSPENKDRFNIAKNKWGHPWKFDPAQAGDTWAVYLCWAIIPPELIASDTEHKSKLRQDIMVEVFRGDVPQYFTAAWNKAVSLDNAHKAEAAKLDEDMPKRGDFLVEIKFPGKNKETHWI